MGFFVVDIDGLAAGSQVFYTFLKSLFNFEQTPQIKLSKV